MGFQHPQQREHMMKGVAAAMRSPKTPSHLKPHLKSRLAPNVELGNKPLSTMEPDDDELMEASARTPDFDSDDVNHQAVNPMEETLGQEATAGQLKRTVSNGGVQLDRPRPSKLMQRAGGRKAKRAKVAKSAFMGDFGGRPKGF